MMRRTVFCLLAAFCLCALSSVPAQAQVTCEVKEGPFVENDTTFLRKIYYKSPNPSECYTHSLYVETDRRSSAYQGFLRCSYDADFDMPWMLSQTDAICRKFALSADLPDALNGIYLPLYKFQGRYYLYTVCEGKVWMQIAKPFFIARYAGESVPYGIVRAGQTSESYRLQVDNGWDKSLRTIEIFPIGEEKGVYVWKCRSEDGDVSYELYVEKSKAEAFDLLNWRITELEDEFDKFEPIDYEGIIRAKKLF